MQKSLYSTVVSFMHLSMIQGTNVLLQLFLIPIILRKVGLSEFGFIMLASSYAALVSILINFGSNQSGIKDIALYKDDQKDLSLPFYTIYYTRLLFMVLSTLVFALISYWVLPAKTSAHFWIAQMIILSELFNPFFFFVGLQQLKMYNLINLLSKLLSLVLILVFIKESNDSLGVNFLIGFSQTVGYLFLFIFIIKRHRLYQFKVSLAQIRQYIQQNIYLTGNNFCVQLQQSVFLFSLSGIGNATLLGAYSLCDKIVWSSRMVMISFFNAIYPKAVLIFKNDPQKWFQLKKRLNIAIGIILSVAAICLYFAADILVKLIVGHPDSLSSLFIQSIALVPLVIGLNLLNVAELFLKNQYSSIFIIAVILLIIAGLLSWVFIHWGQERFYGFFPLLTEIGSIPLYLYFIKRTQVMVK